MAERRTDMVDIGTVRDMRDQILREMRTGFEGVHERQDTANGRLLKVEGVCAELGIRTSFIEKDRDIHTHRRVTDPPLKVDADDKPIKRREAWLVAAALGAAAAALKFAAWLAASFKP